MSLTEGGGGGALRRGRLVVDEVLRLRRGGGAGCSTRRVHSHRLIGCVVPAMVGDDFESAAKLRFLKRIAFAAEMLAPS